MAYIIESGGALYLLHGDTLVQLTTNEAVGAWLQAGAKVVKPYPPGDLSALAEAKGAAEASADAAALDLDAILNTLTSPPG